MTAPLCRPALEAYLDSLRSRYEVHPDDNGCLLVTPFYLPDNTRLGLHVSERPDGTFEVTDFGETHDRLFTSGVTIPPNDKRLITIGRRFGVTIEGGEIGRTSGEAGLDEAINAVIHAVFDMAYLVYTRRPRTVPTFVAEVERLLIGFGRHYDKRYEVLGKTGINSFDYHLPERPAPLLVDTLSASSRWLAQQEAQVTSFKSVDTRQAGGSEVYKIACLVDDRTPEQQEAITERTLSTLRGYLDAVVLWSERERVVELLAA